MADTSVKKRTAKSKLPKFIQTYYDDLKNLEQQSVFSEMGTRTAFFSLLHGAGREHGWTLIAEHEKKVNGKTIRPDGTFKDHLNLVRGYWEAKDTSDNLNIEIEKKRKAGYPLSNIIFEDTATAVLYQHGQRVLTAEMKDADKLADLITQFFRHVEPEIEEFERAVDEFKLRVPDLAQGLSKKIDEAHRTNIVFKKAFADFFELCRNSLNPNIAQAAVDEMLIQHILTERLIREIFDNPEFVRRNVIAAEVEKVMQAMTSSSFDRKTYLKDLDRFYIAIEHAARTMQDWSDKQYFLNTVYERFFQGYSVKLADTMGIVYTPQEIVDFMCASVAEVLETEFGKKLWSDDVYIIDPCTGTGNFIVNLIRHIPKAKLEDMYKNRLFANEIMLLPYYIAALNIEHAYFEQTGRYEGFEGLCFVDTLDMAEHGQTELGFMNAANGVRVERQRTAPITVVIGNPPYNSDQRNENDNNPNRVYLELDQRIRATYAARSNANNKNKLIDPYVRFIKWADERLGDRPGIIAFITNNGFVAGKPFDGMRKSLSDGFDLIYHIDLHGDVRTNPKLSGTTHNVFKIQTGVGITIAIRKQGIAKAIRYHRVPENARREHKLDTLKSSVSITGLNWKLIVPNNRGDWIATTHGGLFETFVPVATQNAKRGGTAEAIFTQFSIGNKSNRDNVVNDFHLESLRNRVGAFAEAYNAQVDRFKRTLIEIDVDEFVDYMALKWSEQLKAHLVRGISAQIKDCDFRLSLWRPFTTKQLCFNPILCDRRYVIPSFLPNLGSEQENKFICVTNHLQIPFVVIASRLIPSEAIGGRQGQCLPFYVYDIDGSNRRENITDWALKQFRTHYKSKKIDKWAIFFYVYGLLHHPGYREKFADNLKRELPRIPFAPVFHPFADAGKKLAALHLDYETLTPWELDFIETPDEPLSYRVDDKMRLSKDKTRIVVNKSLTLAGIPPEVFEYRLGNRSALDWVIDQYKVNTDKRSGITSDPNRLDDPQYIVRLVGQVIRVSVETVKIVNGLPADFA